MDMKYVIGFAFSKFHNSVLLQLKRKGPDCNIGFLNPPGGKVHQYPDRPGETFSKYESYNGAMRREFKEETGLDSEQSDWLKFHYERHPSGAKLHCYVTDKLDISQALSTTNEPNVIVELSERRDGWMYPSGYVWCQYADGLSPTQAEYNERIALQSSGPRGGLAYNMSYLLPMAKAYLKHPEHRYLEG